MTTVQQPAENLAWYSLSAEAAAGQMGVDPGQGLDGAEVDLAGLWRRGSALRCRRW